MIAKALDNEISSAGTNISKINAVTPRDISRNDHSISLSQTIVNSDIDFYEVNTLANNSLTKTDKRSN